MAQYSDRFLLFDNHDLSINEKIETLSKIIADNSFEVFGKTIKSPPNSFEIMIERNPRGSMMTVKMRKRYFQKQEIPF